MRPVLPHYRKHHMFDGEAIGFRIRQLSIKNVVKEWKKIITHEST